MIICVIVYLGLPVLICIEKCKKIPNWCSKKNWYKAIGIIVAANTLALALMIMDNNSAHIKSGELKRNGYGKGKKVEELIVYAEEQEIESPITVVIPEQEYTKEEIRLVFNKCMEELDTIIIGSNSSLDNIKTDLYLPTKMPKRPIEITWELDNYEIMNTEGKLRTENLVAQGSLVELKGTLSYNKEVAQYITTVKVYPPELSKEEAFIKKIEKLIIQQNTKTKNTSTLKLPDIVEGKKIKWSKVKEKNGYIILVFGIVMAGLFVALQRQNMKKAKQERTKQMMIDYPEIVNKISLLIGSGMTIKNAWQKIVSDYQSHWIPEKERHAYEEMKYTFHEMKSGIVEGESYERFGNRCGVQAYTKLGAILSQNVRKGSRGLVDILSIEAMTAFADRKSLAKKLGEEASTKLLLPMFLMLAIVLIIIVVPAFLSIQL